MANVLSQFGLAMKGANKGIEDDQSLQQGQQNLQLGQERIGAARRQGQIQNQQIEEGNIGLAEMRRTQGTNETVRKASETASAMGKSWAMTFEDMAEAVRPTDPQKALSILQGAESVRKLGGVQIIDAYTANSQPGERPDLVGIMNKFGTHQDVVSAVADDKGIITITSKSAPPVKFSVPNMAIKLGMVTPKKIHNVPADALGVEMGPAGPTGKTFEPKKTYAPSRTTLKSYGEEGHPTGETVFDESGKQLATTAGGVSRAGAGGPGGANVRKDLPVLKEITQGVTELGEEYGKTDMSNPLNPKVTLTEKGQKVAMVAEQIRLANQTLAPRTIIDMAVRGKPMWKIENGKRTGVVLYNGQEFPMSTAQGASPPAPRPAAAPAMAPAAPAPKPAESPTAKAARERRAAAQAETVAGIEKFNKTLTAPGVDRERAAAAKKEIARSESEKERSNVIRKEVAERLGRFNKEDQMWFSDNAKNLSPRERKALHDRRARGGYKRGGKVSQVQHYGLG